MDPLLKEKIVNRIRKEHKITLYDTDPIFAIITANEIILEEQLKQLNKTFERQLIEMEMVTNNYLDSSKNLLEKRLILLLQELKKTIEQPQEDKREKPNNTLTNPIVTMVIGFILGYGLSLILL